MNKGNISTFVSILTIAISSIFSSVQLVQAGTLYNGWNVANDSSNDSLSVNSSSQIFEIFAIGTKEDADSFWVAINSNLGVTGLNTGSQVCDSTGRCWSISNQNIGYGDLFLNFFNRRNFVNASDAHNLIGIRFAANNDSHAPSLGVYINAKAIDVERQNAGYWNLGYHHDIVSARGGTASMGDLAWNDPYFAPYTSSVTANPMPNVIESGTKIGDITLLNSSELSAAGFDLSFLPAKGSQTLGFKFDKSLLPIGDYIATLLLECNNDAIAVQGSTTVIEPEKTTVPEPSSILGLITTSLIFCSFQFYKRRQVRTIN